MSGPNYNGRYGPINNSYKCKHCDEPAVYGVLGFDYVLTGKATWLCTAHNQAIVNDRAISGEKNADPAM